MIFTIACAWSLATVKNQKITPSWQARNVFALFTLIYGQNDGLRSGLPKLRSLNLF
jgi:hypothetical protein